MSKKSFWENNKKFNFTNKSVMHCCRIFFCKIFLGLISFLFLFIFALKIQRNIPYKLITCIELVLTVLKFKFLRFNCFSVPPSYYNMRNFSQGTKFCLTAFDQSTCFEMRGIWKLQNCNCFHLYVSEYISLLACVDSSPWINHSNKIGLILKY